MRLAGKLPESLVSAPLRLVIRVVYLLVTTQQFRVGKISTTTANIALRHKSRLDTAVVLKSTNHTQKCTPHTIYTPAPT